jgi:zinc protease
MRAPRLLALLLLTAGPSPLLAQTAVEIPFEKLVLPNGLTLIVHEDHTSPIVAVNIWYHVGSKNEKPGHTGFAHLFEHLMFQGSEHYDQDYLGALERAGATDLNGTTNADRTNFFQTVPTNRLDQVLWLESDRMGHLLGAIDQAKLDEQRGVVQNEKREGENQPYGKVWDFLTPQLYPANHPYSWTTVGSMADLDAAKLDDVKEWFRTYYGAANAVIALAGDVDTKTAKEKVERYFGDIPAGPPVGRSLTWVAKRSGSQRGVLHDRVPQARLYQVWNVTPWGTEDADYLQLAADVLSSGKSSRLYKRLVYDDQLATEVFATLSTREIGSRFVVQVSARQDVSLAKVERAVNQELGRFLALGPTSEELTRYKAEERAAFVRGVERIGGFGGKSDVLLEGEVFAGRPDFYKLRQARMARATPAEVRAAANRWLSDGVYTLEVRPYGNYRTADSSVDRSRLPAPASPVKARFPELERDSLSNGLQLVLAERRTIPQVRFDLLLDAGFASDQSATPGTASLAMAMLDEGTTTRSALQISDELTRLGATLEAGAALDASRVSLEALTENLDRSLALYADVIQHPAFPAAEVERLRQQRIAQIRREEAEPTRVGLRVLAPLLYGAGHAYANPWSGTGTEASVTGINRADLVRYQRTWFRPNHATLVITGATTLREIKPKLERLFAGWRRGDVPAKEIGPADRPAKSVVYLVDRPGALQSVILAGTLAPPEANPDEPALRVMHGVLGGDFGSRINMNLREDKHWSYGAYVTFRDARGQRPFVAQAPVQTDKTSDAVVELEKELRQILKERPASADEVARAQASLTLTLPGSWETMEQLADAVAELVTFGLPDRYFDSYADRILGQTPASVTAVAAKVIDPDRLVWVIVGDRAKIESGIRQLDIGEVRVIDATGKPTT